MKKLLTPTLLIVSSLLLAGCSTSSTVEPPTSDPTESTSPTQNPQPEETQVPAVESIELSLSPGEQYRLEGMITKEEALNLTSATSSNGVAVFVVSEDASYDPFLVAIGVGESVVYLSEKGELTPKYAFKVSVKATPEEIKTWETAKELSEAVIGLSLEDAKATVNASEDSAISYRIYNLGKESASPEDYDLGRVNLYVNESGNVEYSGVG